jgi:ribosomal-protein-alanine N-acetyltransferase
MIGKLIGKLSDRRHTISLEVGEWNLAAHLFFASQGFRATSVQRDFYDNSPDEAYRFEYRVHGWPVSTAAGPEAAGDAGVELEAGESEIKPAFRQVLTRHNRIARFLKQD